MKIALKVKLAFWYAVIVALSLLIFGGYTYLSVSGELNSNLDSSLMNVARSLDHIIKEERLAPTKVPGGIDDKDTRVKTEESSRPFVGPLRPEKPGSDEETNELWAAVYEHILLNPRNYFIQISDKTGNIIWQSENMKNDSLPVLNSAFRGNLKQSYDKQARIGNNVVFSNITHMGTRLRLLYYQSDRALISVGYSVEEINATMSKLLNMLLFAIPIILLVSTLGGLLLSRLSLRSIDDITGTANEITARNLSLRLPEPEVSDELGRLTTTLNKMIERLEASFSRVKQFTSDASHELRTPLTILRGELELVLHEQKSIEEYQVVITSALDEVVRLSGVVENLLDLSRADRGQARMNYRRHDLSQLIVDVTDDVAILSEAKDIKVEADIEQGIVFLYDSGRFHQAFLNIIDNAIKYTAKGGTIFISLKKENQYALITVRDTGRGIPEEDLPNIFDRFYRVDKSRSGEKKGTGLGLSIAKWVVDAHDGKIEVESELDKGTEFRMFLPIKKADQTEYD